MWTRALRALMVLALLAGCGEPSALEVGRVGYTDEELAGMGVEQRETLVRLTALGLAMSEGRLDDLVAPFIRRDLRSLAMQRIALEDAARAEGLDEETLRAAYDRDPESELVVRHLVVLSERWRPEAHGDSARSRALEALELARDGVPFPELVARYSDEPGAAERGGLLSPGREGSWVPEFWRAAAALEEGELSDVVRTEYGFHVIRLEARRPVPFEEARARFLERQVELPDALGRSAAWVAEEARGMVVDTQAIAAWQRGVESDRPLVSWPGAAIPPFLPEDLEEHVRTLPPEVTSDLREDPAVAAGYVESFARSAILLRRAGALEVGPSEAQRTAIEQRWREQAQQWARALGFERGMRAGELKRRALDAVETDRQEALLARRDVLRLGTMLESLYPVRGLAIPGA